MAQFSETYRIPPEPVYIPGKQPRDVFYRLADSFQALRGITEKSGYKILILNLDRSEKSNHIEPSDVYDIASLLVSEVAFLYGELPITRAPIAHNATQLLAGTRQTMSSLRAWINKPDIEFKQRRDSIWRQEICAR